MELPNGFKFRGVSPEFSGDIPPMVKKAIAFLGKLKFKQVVTTAELGISIGYRAHSISQWSTHPSISEYRYKVSASAVIWGSKRTIAELKKQLEKM